MSDRDGDVLVVGSGPAGVSAAFPLVEAGLRVLLVDGGQTPDASIPDGEFLDLRAHDAAQGDWMIGRDGHALGSGATASPKFRVPALDYAFRGFAAANRIEAERFTVVGSLAVGGLSNAWGCGVARFDDADWGDLPVSKDDWASAFTAVAQRVGISGRVDDDLSAYFGLDAHAEGPLPLDAPHRALAGGYERERESAHAQGFRLGRARVAVLTASARPGRQSCDRRGMCLWGCPRDSMYASRQDLPALERYPGFTHLPAHLVERLAHERSGWRAQIRHRGSPFSLVCPRVILAAGTLASTAIAMRSMEAFSSTRLLHLPTAAFVLGLPRLLGRPVEPGVGFAQLAFTLEGDESAEVCGYTFSTHALPVAEFVRHAPLSRAGAASAFRELLPAMIVANCFLPARLSHCRARLLDDGRLRIEGGEAAEMARYADAVRVRLARAFRRTGAWMLPGSFARGATGTDVHYAATLPMRADPKRGESSVDGEIAGMPGVFVVDGAALPRLPTKSHTLALMANAHRIGTRIARACGRETRPLR